MSAAGLLRFRGTAVTFSKTTQTHTASTGVMTPTTATVAGYAKHRARAGGTANEPQASTEDETLVLDFTPTTRGQVPALDSTVVYGGVTYTTLRVPPVETVGLADCYAVEVRR